jgi:hypothetical protein
VKTQTVNLKQLESEIRTLLVSFREVWDGYPVTETQWAYISKRVAHLNEKMQERERFLRGGQA